MLGPRSGDRSRGPRPRGCLRVLLVAVAALLIAWALRERLLAAVGGFLVVRDPPARADAILVLSGDVAERVREAADLYREGWSRTLLLTTPVRVPAALELERLGVRIPTEPEIARGVAEALGVAPGDLVALPGEVESTEAEARAARAFAAARGWRRLIVVTSPYHTRRTRRLFREVLGAAGVETIVVPSRHGAFRAADWWRDRAGVRNLVIEYQKLLFYALPGHER